MGMICERYSQIIDKFSFFINAKTGQFCIICKSDRVTMSASESFAEFLREQLAPLGSITMRRMFGKTGVFCDGLMLGMVRDNTLYFRVDDENRAAFKEAESFAPLNYAKQDATIDLVLARAGAPVRRAHRLGARSARRGAAGRGKAEQRDARTKTQTSSMKTAATRPPAAPSISCPTAKWPRRGRSG